MLNKGEGTLCEDTLTSRHTFAFTKFVLKAVLQLQYLQNIIEMSDLKKNSQTKHTYVYVYFNIKMLHTLDRLTLVGQSGWFNNIDEICPLTHFSFLCMYESLHVSHDRHKHYVTQSISLIWLIFSQKISPTWV